MDMTWMVGANNPMAQDNSFIEKVWEYQALLYVVLIPLYAVIAKITFFNYKAYSYLHHMVIIAYTQAHLSITLFLPTIIMLMLGANLFKFVYYFSVPIMILYTAYCYKKMYGISLGKIIVKTLFFLLLGSTLYIGASMVVGILLVLTGVLDPQQFIDAQKASNDVSYIVSSAMNWTS